MGLRGRGSRGLLLVLDGSEDRLGMMPSEMFSLLERSLRRVCVLDDLVGTEKVLRIMPRLEGLPGLCA